MLRSATIVIAFPSFRNRGEHETCFSIGTDTFVFWKRKLLLRPHRINLLPCGWYENEIERIYRAKYGRSDDHTERILKPESIGDWVHDDW